MWAGVNVWVRLPSAKWKKTRNQNERILRRCATLEVFTFTRRTHTKSNRAARNIQQKSSPLQGYKPTFVRSSNRTISTCPLLAAAHMGVRPDLSVPQFTSAFLSNSFSAMDSRTSSSEYFARDGTPLHTRYSDVRPLWSVAVMSSILGSNKSTAPLRQCLPTTEQSHGCKNVG